MNTAYTSTPVIDTTAWYAPYSRVIQYMNFMYNNSVCITMSMFTILRFLYTPYVCIYRINFTKMLLYFFTICSCMNNLSFIILYMNIWWISMFNVSNQRTYCLYLQDCTKILCALLWTQTYHDPQTLYYWSSKRNNVYAAGCLMTPIYNFGRVCLLLLLMHRWSVRTWVLCAQLKNNI